MSFGSLDDIPETQFMYIIKRKSREDRFQRALKLQKEKEQCYLKENLHEILGNFKHNNEKTKIMNYYDINKGNIDFDKLINNGTIPESMIYSFIHKINISDLLRKQKLSERCILKIFDNIKNTSNINLLIETQTITCKILYKHFIQNDGILYWEKLIDNNQIKSMQIVNHMLYSCGNNELYEKIKAYSYLLI